MLRKKFKDHHIILGSQSPRRKELLQGLDVEFTTQPLNVDESYDVNLQKEEITEFLCGKKAQAFQGWQPNDILITSDTIVWLDNKPLEKPKNKAEANDMLSKIQNVTHEVITSVGIYSPNKKTVFSDKTLVTFGPLTEEEIDYYITQYNPQDKAGAYGVQEWIGYVGVKKLEGSYFTVMGLPVYKLYHALKEF